MKQMKRIKLDPNIFNAAVLSDEMNLDIATGIVESHLASAAVDKQHMLVQFLDQRGMFEYLTSVLSEPSYRRLAETALATVPTAAKEFERSFAYTLLKRLSNYFGALSLLPDMDERGRAVESAAQVLESLAIRYNALKSVAAEPNDAKAKGKARRMSHSARKKVKAAARIPAVDETAFAKIGRDVPNDKEEAQALVREILEEQQNTLKFYLETLRKPAFAAIIKNSYVQEVPAIPDATSGNGLGQATVLHAHTFEATAAMRDALSLESADGFGPWRVFISQDVEKYLRINGRRNPLLHDVVMKKLMELSCGLFSPDNQKRLDGSECDMPIYEAKMTSDTRLVYRIACVQEIESEAKHSYTLYLTCSVVLWVYGVYTHTQLRGRRFWDTMSRKVSGAGSEYRQRCKPRRGYGGSAVMPMSWPPTKETAKSEHVDLPDLSVKDKEELQALLVLSRNLPPSATVQENLQPSHKTSYSPSSTTKTRPPCSSYRELTLCYLSGHLGQRYGSLMFTDKKNRLLFYIQGHALFSAGAGQAYKVWRYRKTTTMIIKMVGNERMWRSHQHTGAMSRPRQVFLTQSAILAEKVQEYYRKLTAFFEARDVVSEGSEKVLSTYGKNQPSGLYDRDEEDEYREDLPKKFSELKDKHFPLFVTYHRLCRLLEEDLAEDDRDIRRRTRATYGDGGDDQATSNDYMQQQRKSFVSYATFLESYWKHFPEGLTKKLDPFSIFADFMGVIKGSEQALRNKSGCLDRITYTGGSPDSSRDAIYNLFELYTRKKTSRSEYDAADRTRAILQSLRKDGVPGTKLDYVYVDEVQDNLLIDTKILRTICRRPEGMFWAGDTAQTISAGSSFQFNELKAFQFRLENETNVHNPMYSQLSRNFRSHSGIVQAAQTVLEPISQLWPHTIDILEEEKGMIEGPKPLFIGGVGNLKAPHFEQFMHDADNTAIEFGHQQCVLVRTDAAREQLRNAFGDVGIVLTIHESKGLEFEDVLLYNFFADSTISASQWRVLLRCLPSQACPAYDEMKHRGVCFEHLSLMVAEVSLLWSHKQQIDIWIPGTEVPRLSQSSSQEEWAITAESLFHKKHYKESMLAYGRAGHDFLVPHAIAEAFYLREMAQKQAVSPHKKESDSVAAFTRAAKAFHRVAENVKTDHKKYHRRAAQCYARANDNASAAACCELAELYTVAAKYHRLAGSFDDAVRVVKTFEVESSVAQNIVDVSALFYMKGGQLSKATELLGSTEEVLDHADMYGMDVAKAALLEQCGQYAEASALHLENSDLPNAVRLCLHAPLDRECVERVAARLMDEFWNFAALVDGPFDAEHARFKTLNSLISKLLEGCVHAEQRMELSLLPALASGDKARLAQLGLNLLHANFRAAAFMCLDQAFLGSLQIETASPSTVQSHLNRFFPYIKALEALIFAPDPANNVILHKLLGFRPADDGKYQVRSDSLLYKTFTIQTLARREGNAAFVNVPRWDLERLLQAVLKTRLLDRVRRAMEVCKVCKAFTVCLQHAMEGQCNSSTVCARTHLTAYDHQAYQLRVSLHTTVIRIYQTLNGIEEWPTRQEQQRYWLIRLKESLHPPITKLGSLLNTDDRTISPEACQVISAWLSDGLFASKRNPPYFLNDFFRFSALAKSLAGSYAPDYIHRAPCIANATGSWLLRGKEQVDIVQDALRFFTKAPLALSSAILMMKHIIEKELPIEVGLLCDLLDTLCGMLVVARRLKQGASVHTLTFPGSWFLRLQDVFDGSCPDDIRLGWMYLKSVKLLLEQLSNQAGYLRLGSGGPPFVLRDVYIARICQNVCYLGYNLYDEALRVEIQQVVTSLRLAPGRYTFPHAYRRYATARDWVDLKRAVRQNALGGAGDQLIELVDAARNASPPLISIHRIKYHKLSDIPGLLSDYLASTSRGSSTLASQPDSQATFNDGATRDDIEDAADQHEPDVHQNGEQSLLDPTDQQDLEPVAFTNVQSKGAASYSEEDFEKVRRALVVYRNARVSSMAHQKNVGRTSILFARECKAYLAEAANMSRQKSKFHARTFSWAFPHIAAALKGILRSLRAQKTSVKKQLVDQKTSHLKLDELMGDMTTLNMLNKTADKLSKAIEPCANIHKVQDRYLEMLSKLANDVEEFISQSAFPIGIVQEWRDMMQVGINGIRVQKVPVWRKKPELVVDDDLDPGE
ncbi:uncharacterized protein PHACADRAFT_179724 [Phanerochaete carnosa HHB-10118-sp]|uniref:UvrD-like helicase ATP-binding domain-containing protein n=1 Tax=Phanerochaete carnosa (strain HHB-10118-sp) TaxID=650164 RepID=K5WLX4_PHACS|nr:uncharacterized protein PHACADRAFT_179724 [Phanerochaete carnosa HHB-10118-sp]EKM60420.1 hypothetical protein PHACADRAFT_179724 [Phanerochaete carnosa HHB-10118-sp]